MCAEFLFRRLHPDDATAYMALRLESLTTEPQIFGSSPADDRMRSLEFVRKTLAEQDEQAVFGAFEGDRLVGIVGVIRDEGLKERHKARVWGVYVTPAMRGKGIARSLLEAAIDHARGWREVDQLHLTVVEAAPAAKALYVSLGFCVWGREPRVLCWQGQFIDEDHLVLRLR